MNIISTATVFLSLVSSGTLTIQSPPAERSFTVRACHDSACTRFKRVRLDSNGRITYRGGFKSDGEALRMVMEVLKSQNVGQGRKEP